MKRRRTVICMVLLVPVVLVVLTILFILHVTSRIVVNPQAISNVAHDAVLITLKNGGSKQKLEMIRALEKIAPDAKPFIPALFAVTHDSDPAVSKAAADLIQQIDPTAFEPDSM
jgi:hypothetical protein